MRSGKIIVFDGVCTLCSHWVAFVLKHDRTRQFRFASMQSNAGNTLLAKHGLDAGNPVSLLLVEDERGYTDSEAIIRVVSAFGGMWHLVAVLRLLPQPLLNASYRWLARNRYRWFGRRDVCMTLMSDMADRFLQ
jgi:predicted DCC family thiol-disulfide oxidoreductase YuxK